MITNPIRREQKKKILRQASTQFSFRFLFDSLIISCIPRKKQIFLMPAWVLISVRHRGSQDK